MINNLIISKKQLIRRNIKSASNIKQQLSLIEDLNKSTVTNTKKKSNLPPIYKINFNKLIEYNNIDSNEIKKKKIQSIQRLKVIEDIQKIKTQQENRGKNADFKTKDFFNEAEQQIEKVLIRNGFRVLSRNKFEAKLRTLRDESKCNYAQYNCLYSEVPPETRMILDALKIKFDKSTIDPDQYAEEVSLEKLFVETDVLSLHVPLTEETTFLVNDKFMSRFKKNICCYAILFMLL